MKNTRDNPGMFRELWVLGAPTILEHALQTMVGYVDTAMVGAIGATASAAVGLSTTINWLLSGIFFSASLGLLSFISRYWGAGDRQSARRASAQGIWLVLLYGIPETILALLCSGAMPRWLQASPEIWKDGSDYFFIISLPLLLRGAMTVFGNILRANHDSQTPMKINIGVNLINVVLNALFIGQNLHLLGLTIPAMGWGVRGAAAATAISQSLGGIAMFLAAMKNPETTLKGQPLKPDIPMLRKVTRVSLPLLGERLVVCGGYVTFTSVVASLGTIPMAAHTIALQVEEAFYIPGYGIQTAVSTLSGNALGRQNAEDLRRVVRAGMGFAVSIMALMAGGLFFAAGSIMSLFTPDQEVVALGASVLRLVALSEPLFAMFIIMEGVFHGIGENRYPFAVGLFSMWVMRIALGYTVVHFFHGNLNAVWICMILDNVSRCVLLNGYYLMGKWKKHFAHSIA